MRTHLSLLAALLLHAPALAGDEVVMLVGEDEYGSAETMPELAAELLLRGRTPIPQSGGLLHQRRLHGRRNRIRE